MQSWEVKPRGIKNFPRKQSKTAAVVQNCIIQIRSIYSGVFERIILEAGAQWTESETSKGYSIDGCNMNNKKRQGCVLRACSLQNLIDQTYKPHILIMTSTRTCICDNQLYFQFLWRDRQNIHELEVSSVFLLIILLNCGPFPISFQVSFFPMWLLKL